MDYDAIVIGGGHAGIEAALALARLDFSTLLITQNLDCIGKMSCNPAVGGLAKGNVVREIDALGGEMGKLIDATMIQFRMLNRSKGPAVQAPRAQADLAAYSQLARWTLEKQRGLGLFQDTVTDLLLSADNHAIAGVRTERGHRITARAVVLTTGTFMEAAIFIGEYTASSGRLGEPAAVGLGKALREKGFDVGRLKTGTPARVLKSSLNFDRMTLQPGDIPMLPFSFSHATIERETIPCYITYTNPQTHRIIRDNIHRSPLYGGKIKGIGPRYCPSIEDKVMRFGEKDRHQIFVEPEGLSTEQMYLNGISSSLPEEVQEKFLRTVAGLEELVIMKPGYAVEYDYLNPTDLYPSLESKRASGLFIAGQTNGTSGYEEAAGQGLMAGINAALKLRGREPLLLSRSEAYIGVMIDDLVTIGTREPYRLFTSRAEHRLALRHETADVRLMEKGHTLGLQSPAAWEKFLVKKGKIEEIRELLRIRKIGNNHLIDHEEFRNYLGKSLATVLKDPHRHIHELIPFDAALSEADPALLYQVEVEVKYEGYISKQDGQVQRFKKMENMRIPPDFDYDGVNGLSYEAREKLKKIKPVSLGQAQRIPGVRYTDVSLLLYFLRKQ